MHAGGGDFADGPQAFAGASALRGGEHATHVVVLGGGDRDQIRCGVDAC